MATETPVPRTPRSTRAVLTEGAVGPLLVKLAVPMVLGVLSMVVYNLVDTFFVGRLGKDQLAALSFTFPVVLVVSSLALGLGMGASAVLSRAIGRGDRHEVQRLATDSLLLALMIVGVITGIGLLTIRPLFAALGAEPHIIDFIAEYMQIWYPGMILVVVPMVGNSAIRATGDTRTPGIVMMIGAVTNAILDPVLIFGLGPVPALGIRGAAAATLVGRFITFTVALYVLGVRERLLVLKGTSLRATLRSWKELLYIGLPNAASRMIIPLGAGVVTRLVADFGIDAVAGYGVATRIEFFALAAVNALSAVVAPFVGQNTGAGRLDRVSEGYRAGQRFSLILGVVSCAILMGTAHWIARAFSSAPEVVTVTARYLRIVSAAYGLQGIYLVSVSALNALRKPFHAAGLAAMEMFALIVPLSLAGSRLFGDAGIFVGIGVSYAVTGLVSRFLVRKTLAPVQRSAGGYDAAADPG